ncbi:hypothetical protein COMA2_10401 [Candidatus Nitrospira nitrificans]|uniref:Uncharacterized protein n=1 Tax=Candidatus Nitrospira nitrificans TaxID=1742973 RepID=A0A0S4L5V8_9BACT|nr:hypothetical protein COMA2_10401 [Candidatus Nitrospira nitrificans]
MPLLQDLQIRKKNNRVSPIFLTGELSARRDLSQVCAIARLVVWCRVLRTIFLSIGTRHDSDPVPSVGADDRPIRHSFRVVGRRPAVRHLSGCQTNPLYRDLERTQQGRRTDHRAVRTRSTKTA